MEPSSTAVLVPFQQLHMSKSMISQGLTSNLINPAAKAVWLANPKYTQTHNLVQKHRYPWEMELEGELELQTSATYDLDYKISYPA
jgi:hypothetical protein